jgi:hypothetical protein
VAHDPKVFTELKIDVRIIEHLIKPKVKMSIHIILVVLVLDAPLEGSFHEVRVSLILAVPWFHFETLFKSSEQIRIDDNTIEGMTTMATFNANHRRRFACH